MGFNLLIGNEQLCFQTNECAKYICKQIRYKNTKINAYFIKKFEKDKAFVETPDCILLLDGIILNKKDFVKQEDLDWGNTLIRLYETKGNTFYKAFRGSFCGIIIDKVNKKTIIFTDHIGSKFIYYYFSENQLAVCTDIKDLYTLFKEFGIDYRFDQNAAYMLLSYGFVLDDFTLCKQIKKILPGNYLSFQDNKLQKKQYYILPKPTLKGEIDENEVIENLDNEFRNAVKLQFDKDFEYGYKHLITLSGGLDSRMLCWVSHDLGYKDQLNITFSQTNYLDEKVSKKIAEDLRHEWLFKALDNGLFLKDIDDNNLISGGGVLYYSLAHSYSIIKYLNFTNIGMIHTGALGDIVIGSFIKNISWGVNKLDGAYSRKYLHKVRVNHNLKDLPEKEIDLIYSRAFNGANSGLLMFQQHTETLSPFYNIDFFEFCLSIPIEHRINHELYKKWILKKYPKAGNYIWERTGIKLTKKELSLNVMGRKVSVKKLFAYIMTKTGIKSPKIATKNHMNPLDYWYRTNLDIRNFQDQYFADNISRLDFDKSLYDDVIKLYKAGNTIEKNQVLTLLSAYKLFF